MKTATVANGSKTSRKENRLVEALNQTLADTYALLGLTHLAHWNVEGSDFFFLHQAFENQYKELFEAVDEIAERVRALDAYAIGGLGKLARTANFEEFSAPMSQEDYVTALIVDHQKLVNDAREARDLAESQDDLESQDLMVRRIQSHEKTLWMLKSYLKR